MSSPAPALRADLTLHEQGEVVRVSAPGGGGDHLLRRVEWDVARCMDGRRSVAALARRARRMGLPATPRALAAFVRELEARGLLEGPQPRPRFQARRWPEEKQRRVGEALRALKEERYAAARAALDEALARDPACEELRAFAEGARKAEIDATSEADEQSALAALVRAEGEGLVLSPPVAAAPEAVAEVARGTRWHWPHVALAIAAAVAAALALPVSDPLSGEGVLTATDRVTVRAAVEGRLDRVAAADGAAVRPGDLLAQLADPDLRARLDAAGARRRQAELSLQEARSGPRTEQLDRARASAARAAAQARALETAAGQAARAAKDGHLSDAELQAANRAQEAARWEERSAEAALHLVEAGATAEAVAQRRAELDEARAAEAALSRALEAGAVRAPRAGVLRAPDLVLQEGAWVRAGEPLGTIETGRAFRVDGRLSELDAEGLAPGLPLRVQLPGDAPLVLDGRVQSLGERLEPRPGAPAAVRVCGVVEDPSGRARDGMAVHLQVLRGRAPLARVLWRQVRHFLAAHGP